MFCGVFLIFNSIIYSIISGIQSQVFDCPFTDTKSICVNATLLYKLGFKDIYYNKDVYFYNSSYKNKYSNCEEYNLSLMCALNQIEVIEPYKSWGLSFGFGCAGFIIGIILFFVSFHGIFWSIKRL